jgi:hypothetical protein
MEKNKLGWCFRICPLLIFPLDIINKGAQSHDFTGISVFSKINIASTPGNKKAA